MNYERIDELLAEKGMSRRQLAIAAGISIDTLSSWFRRKTKNIDTKSIKAIARVLGVQYLELVSIHDPESDEIIQSIISRLNKKPIPIYTPNDIGMDMELIQIFHKLSYQSQCKVFDFAENLLKAENSVEE